MQGRQYGVWAPLSFRPQQPTTSSTHGADVESVHLAMRKLARPIVLL